jgi:hypothetical protein
MKIMLISCSLFVPMSNNSQFFSGSIARECKECSLGQYAIIHNNIGKYPPSSSLIVYVLHWLSTGICRSCPHGASCLTEGVFADPNYYLSVTAHKAILHLSIVNLVCAMPYLEIPDVLFIPSPSGCM